MNVLTRIVDDWRVRLASVSEFMQQLNQVIARHANIEENCKSRFWEGRFKFQPLLTANQKVRLVDYEFHKIPVVHFRPEFTTGDIRGDP
jgi:hypothetical protein